MAIIETKLPSEESGAAADYPSEQHYVFLSGHIVFLNEPLPLFKDLVQPGKLSNEDFLKLELALQEAIANAVEHGNLELSSSLREEVDSEGKDRYSQLKEERLKDNRFASRLVYISAFANDHEVKVTVRDEGKGFIDEKSKATNLIETDLDLPRCSGRGLILIRAAADVVKFNDVGNQVEFVKKFT